MINNSPELEEKIKQSQMKIEVKITRFILWQVYN